MSKTDTIAQATNTVSLADEEGVKQVLVNSVLGLWDVVNNLTRLRPRVEIATVYVLGQRKCHPKTVQRFCHPFR